MIAFGVGTAAFTAALAAAWWRGRRGPRVAGGKRDNRSMLWIALQAVGIGLAGLGPVEVTLPPLSARALIPAAAVLVLMLGAAALFDWSSRTMGSNWALVARTRGDAELVTGGPFAYVRNPIYVALAMFMVAMALAYGHGAALLLAAPVYAAATWLRVASEERILRAEFGNAYDRYAARVARFVPGVI